MTVIIMNFEELVCYKSFAEGVEKSLKSNFKCKKMVQFWGY